MADDAGPEAAEPTGSDDPIERILDVCVYAPLGFVVDARRVVPELAQRGRAQATVARMVGEFAVSWGNTRLQSALTDVQDQAVDLLRRVGVAAPERPPAPGAPVDDAPEGSEAPEESEGPAPVVVPDASEPIDPVPGSIEPIEELAEADLGPLDEESLAWLEGRSPDDEAQAAALAIPDYDNLSASQVVPRLDGLTADELEAVRRYEQDHRHRKTILSRVAQLQDGPG